jgi:hypothetical protein
LAIADAAAWYGSQRQQVADREVRRQGPVGVRREAATLVHSAGVDENAVRGDGAAVDGAAMARLGTPPSAVPSK